MALKQLGDQKWTCKRSRWRAISTSMVKLAFSLVGPCTLLRNEDVRDALNHLKRQPHSWILLRVRLGCWYLCSVTLYSSTCLVIVVTFTTPSAKGSWSSRPIPYMVAWNKKFCSNKEELRLSDFFSQVFKQETQKKDANVLQTSEIKGQLSWTK